jgi:arylsulfatase A-like enzyme
VRAARLESWVLLGLCGTALVATAGCSDEPASQAAQTAPVAHGRPNVLLVTLDTTRVDRFGCYGYSKPTTPNFDALARDGVQFDLAITTSATTPVSHSSILSGLNNYQHGVRVILGSSGYRLPDVVPTLATVLKDNGWETGAFLSSFPVSKHFGFDRGFDVFDSGVEDAGADKFSTDGRWEVPANQRRSDETTDVFLKWLEPRRKPFFAWIHYWDPHDPHLLPPEELLAKFPPDGGRRPHPKLDTYDAEVAYVDQNFGRVIEALKLSGRYDNTIIVITSDHGEGLGDHDWMNHRLLYQEQIHAPLLLHAPGIPKGRRVPDLVRIIDIYPTVLDLLSVPPPQPVQGRSMMPLVRGEPDEPRIAYADQLNKWDQNARMIDKRPYDELIYCAMDREWKLIYRDTHPDQSLLYHIAVDPREESNVLGQYPEQASRLKKLLDEFDGYRRIPFPAGGNDAEALKRLEALGYAGEAVSGDNHDDEGGGG